MDLSNDWLRREVGTNSVYYGYSTNLTSVDSDRSWSILKLETIDTIDSVYWNDNEKLSFNAKWSERVANFTTPSGALGITYSTTIDTYSNVSINTSWNFLSGVNTYKISVTDQNGILYGSFKSPLNQPFLNNYGGERITDKLIGLNTYNFIGTTNMTYSITIDAINTIAASSSTITIVT